jgi:hypothetical protein
MVEYYYFFPIITIHQTKPHDHYYWSTVAIYNENEIRSNQNFISNINTDAIPP